MLGSNKTDYREEGRFIKEDGDVKKLKNDPHNPKNLLRRRKDSKGDGHDQDPANWKPTPWNDTGAGKGDAPRPIAMSHEEWGLRYDLATGKITREEYNKKMEEFYS